MVTGISILLIAAVQTTPPPPPPPPAPPPIVRVAPMPPAEPALPAIDPARMAAADALVAKVFPTGTYAKLMAGNLRTIATAIAQKSAQEGQPDNARPPDPHAAERAKIAMDVILDELSGVLVQMEPGVRRAMARAYARRFTAPEMGELATFFTTPLGRKYALESLRLVEDPELLAQFMAMEPRMQAELPRIIEKVINATAHLPEPRGDATS